MNTLEGKAWRALAAAKGLGPKALWRIAAYLASRVPDHIEVAQRILTLKAAEPRQDAPPVGMKS